MGELQNTPWGYDSHESDCGFIVFDINGFTFAYVEDEPTAKAIAALPDTLERLDKLEVVVKEAVIEAVSGLYDDVSDFHNNRYMTAQDRDFQTLSEEQKKEIAEEVYEFIKTALEDE